MPIPLLVAFCFNCTVRLFNLIPIFVYIASVVRYQPLCSCVDVFGSASSGI